MRQGLIIAALSAASFLSGDGVAQAQFTPAVYRPDSGQAQLIRVAARRRRVVVKRRTKKKSAAIVGGSAATGAAVGALAGGGKGAAIGALAGGGGGLAYDRATHKKTVVAR